MTSTSSNPPVPVLASIDQDELYFPKQYPRSPQERTQLKARQDKLAEELATVDLRSVFDALAEHTKLEILPKQDGDPNKWKIVGVGNIITKGQRWQNTMSFKKGYGGVALVAMACDAPWHKAIHWMWKAFGDQAHDLSATPESEVLLFSPPDANDISTAEVRRYLSGTGPGQRHLPPDLVDHEIARYQQSHRAGVYGTNPESKDGKTYRHLHNAIFLGPASAEVRATEGDFNGCLGGSDTETSGYRVPFLGQGEPVVALTEAAIDALSYNAMFPGRVTISCNGSGSRFPLQYRLATELLDKGYGLRPAFDADEAGDVAAQRLANALLLRKILSTKLPMEKIDQWILEEGVDFPLPSSLATHPAENWFNQLLDSSLGGLPLDSASTTRVDHKLTPPEKVNYHASFKICKPIGTWPARTLKTIPISSQIIAYFQDTLDCVRDRPPTAKDWNDELKKLGSAFHLDYKNCFQHNFAQLPKLPPCLAKLRSLDSEVSEATVSVPLAKP